MRLARFWWTLIAIDVATGVVINFILAIVEPSPAGQIGTSLLRYFSYFTEESNIFVLAATIPLAMDPQHDGRAWRVLRVMSLLGITITGLVFAIVLAPTSHPHGAGVASNLMLHYISPVGSIAGWLLFGPRPRIALRTLAQAIIWPLLWVGYILAQGPATGWYPYDFLNVTVHGYGRVGINLAFILILSVVILALLRLGDRLPASRAAA
ncbi:MAG: Pr6Pr family membrane protein [Candidatus Dormibacteraeota bacterium]|nr:Pr6Pr family membrane protein [Candidatus Dormibacteraeota bacterium]MBV9524254.1 Pr6Pr family membrane protein [Candidatus Dormibacteraeota bacterium]